MTVVKSWEQTVRIHSIECDGCGRRLAVITMSRDAVELRNAVADRGWAVSMGRHYCPDCKEAGQ